MAKKEVNKDYSRYLLKEEQLIRAYKIGFKEMNTVLLTNLKIIILEKFPRNQIEVEYKDVEVVEYYTYIKWLELLYAVVAFLAPVILFALKEQLKEEISKLVPVAESVAHSSTTEIIIIIVVIAAIFFGLFKLGVFLLSLMGKFRILLYEQAPVEITTKCTTEVEELIKQIEQKKRNHEQKGKKRKKNEA